MSKHLIITLTGPDRVGFVEGVTKPALDLGANVEQSRMVRLGGEFAVLMLLSVEDDRFDALRKKMADLETQGYQVTVKETDGSTTAAHAGRMPYTVTVTGADHEGIIHSVTRALAEQGIHIESLTTGMVPAPMSGTPLFTMTALVLAPPTVSLSALRGKLSALGDLLNVDTDAEPYVG